MKVLSLDISGNFVEGKGTTGLCYMENGEPIQLGECGAKEYTTQEEYWFKHKDLIEKLWPDHLVIEGYRLYHHKGMSASSQANSLLETPQLLGYLRMVAYELNIPLTIQYAKDIKTRWSEDVLTHKGILEKKGNRYYFKGELTSTHKRDALKHALHYWRYNRENK